MQPSFHFRRARAAQLSLGRAHVPVAGRLPAPIAYPRKHPWHMRARPVVAQATELAGCVARALHEPARPGMIPATASAADSEAGTQADVHSVSGSLLHQKARLPNRKPRAKCQRAYPPCWVGFKFLLLFQVKWCAQWPAVAQHTGTPAARARRGEAQPRTCGLASSPRFRRCSNVLII